jgi:hypothetical protein
MSQQIRVQLVLHRNGRERNPGGTGKLPPPELWTRRYSAGVYDGQGVLLIR